MRTPSASSPSLTPLPFTDGDEWVETHAGRQAHETDSATNAGEIADIPDLDGDGPQDDEGRIAKGLGCVSLGGRGGGEGLEGRDALLG